jgi:hypothetical protein
MGFEATSLVGQVTMELGGGVFDRTGQDFAKCFFFSTDDNGLGGDVFSRTGHNLAWWWCLQPHRSGLCEVRSAGTSLVAQVTIWLGGGESVAQITVDFEK